MAGALWRRCSRKLRQALQQEWGYVWRPSIQCWGEFGLETRGLRPTIGQNCRGEPWEAPLIGPSWAEKGAKPKNSADATIVARVLTMLMIHGDVHARVVVAQAPGSVKSL